MQIVGTILSGNSQTLVGEAILSVTDWVDVILVVDTGITDNTLAIAQDSAGAKFRVEEFAWCNDFARARNFALECAAGLGASWALTVDTDERLSFPGIESSEELRSRLDSAPDVLVWLVASRDGSYAKERFIRVPTKLRWSGRTHEALVGAKANERRVLAGVEFFEKPKTREQSLAKLRRDLDVLRIETQEQPDNARWWYYLGQTLEQLEQHRAAADAYERCYELRDGWAEQAAWACFRAATCRLRLDKVDQALEVCTLGLAKQPQSPELAWLAGFCSFKLGHFANAVAWEEMAVAMGHFEGNCSGRHRISFRHLPGWYEGPYDVLRFAWQKLGQPHRAEECERKLRAAKERRWQHWMPRRSHEAPDTRDNETKVSGQSRTGSRGEHGTRVAVLGLYSSGSTATAGVLHYLGVRLGKAFWSDYFEPRWLSQQLRRWWNEPELREAVAKEERVRLLGKWARDMETGGGHAIGAKHPLLTLCGDDLREAWGAETKFIWTWRPLEESIASIQRRQWWPGMEKEIQTRLWSQANEFFTTQTHLKVEFADMLQSPEREIDRIIEFLGLRPTKEQKRNATMFIERRG